jgi:hypothetical protein
VVSDVPGGVAVTGHVLKQANLTGAELVDSAIAKPNLQFPRESNQPSLVRCLVKIHEPAALVLLYLKALYGLQLSQLGVG